MKKTAIFLTLVIAGFFSSCDNTSSVPQEGAPAEFVSSYHYPWDSSFVATMFDNVTTARHEKRMNKFLAGKRKYDTMVVTDAQFYMPKRYVKSSPDGSTIGDKYVIAPKKMFTLAIKVFEKSLGVDSTAKLIYDNVRFRTPSECVNGSEYIEYDNTVDILNYTLPLCSNELQVELRSIVLRKASGEEKDLSWIRYYETH